ncbi:hypothetical protein C2R22_18675 [Salinigranum rubrum]|uniref:Ig-like domain-containing protein n=1 Tax=Salinigranum rubrum TaxID=755307 RepID=A0A2I8VNC2_9EURY|nr:hypothetical protein [Salinigranum rubrum]AUV83418.1 hypothetical protein C2R22_18675 [Salinigranum rubrum]
MRRRSALRALLGTVGLGSLSGCNALVGSNATTPAEAASSPESGGPRSSPSSVATSASTTAEPYHTADAPLLDRPRGVHVRNLGSTERFLTAVVSDDEREVFADSAPVPAGETASFPDLLATAGTYDVLVETADGDRGRYEWDVSEELDDLWVDLTPGLSFRRPVLCLTDCAFAVTDGDDDGDGDQVVAYDVPADLDVAAALGRVPALALDNDATESRRVRLHVWQAGTLHFASTFVLPADVRLLVPVSPANRRYDVVVRTPDGEAIYDWQPSVRTTLYASVAETPTFRCGYADHDVQVRNETDRARRVVVRVLTGDETLFERVFELDPREVETVPSAVDPAGPFRFEVEIGSETDRYNWVRCAPNGPIVVAVSDDGVSVSVRPTAESS